MERRGREDGVDALAARSSSSRSITRTSTRSPSRSRAHPPSSASRRPRSGGRAAGARAALRDLPGPQPASSTVSSPRSSSRSSTSWPNATIGAATCRYLSASQSSGVTAPSGPGRRPPRRRARATRGRAPRPGSGATCRARAAETISGSVESGRPTPTRTRPKSGEPRPALQRLQAVVAGEPAAEPRADVAERQVDLVVDGQHVVEVDLERAARRAGAAPGLVHEGLRQQHRDARPAGPGAALGEQAVELLARRCPGPSARSARSATCEADVVRRALVARAGVAEPDDQPVRGRDAAEEAHGAVLLAGRLRRRRPEPPRRPLRRPRPHGLAVLADEPGLGLDPLPRSSARGAAGTGWR